MATEDKNQETKKNQKAIKETKQTGIEDLSPDELEDLKVILKQRKEEREKIENKKKDIVQLLDELSYDQLIKAEADIGLIRYEGNKKVVKPEPEKEYWMEGAEEEENDAPVKEQRSVPAEKDKTGLGIVCGLFLSLIFGWIIGLCYPYGSDERRTYFKAWGITVAISLAIGILIAVIVCASTPVYY